MIAWVFIFISAVFSIPPAQAAQDFEFGPRPPLAVFDPVGLLDPAVAKAVSDPLAAAYQKEGIDVMVVLLREIGQAPPEHVAGRFAAAWCEAPIHCVVLHIPGREGSPWIVPTGKLIGQIDPAAVKTAVANAQRRIAAESTDADKIKTSATAASDMLRIWMGSAIARATHIGIETTKMRLELEAESRRWKLGVMIAAAAFVPLVAGIVLIASLVNHRGPRRFARNHPSPPRLGAPHCGGAHATADLGPPRLGAPHCGGAHATADLGPPPL
jgi:hypothetical protein